MPADLTAALRTAGYALAHAAGSIQLGRTLCTMAIVVSDGQHTIVRYESVTISESIAAAYAHLSEQLGDDAHAALVFDGFVRRPDEEHSDALVAEILGPGGLRHGRIVQAYRPSLRLGLPLIGRRWSALGPAILDESLNERGATERVFEGVRDHPFGARLFGLSGK